ncbi:hypothetical protein LX36DRAFT_659148, partial [Colletotrichum falcatum]
MQLSNILSLFLLITSSAAFQFIRPQIETVQPPRVCTCVVGGRPVLAHTRTACSGVGRMQNQICIVPYSMLADFVSLLLSRLAVASTPKDTGLLDCL